MSKVCFEEWLWELTAAEIKNLRSDNGVFTADIFCDDCKIKHQSQSFSGVGAKHQNLIAERVIQPIIYIWLTLSWSIGITPLELLTKTKADRRDLLRSHVWGCPVFVLDPKLQYGKKIPTWTLSVPSKNQDVPVRAYKCAVVRKRMKYLQ
eukprot:CCRYP_000302-RA/>CCRYP_000302-RA protein AED:0.27 eAED:0.10 QI:0/0/0/1/0/0/2/0/149